MSSISLTTRLLARFFWYVIIRGGMLYDGGGNPAAYLCRVTQLESSHCAAQRRFLLTQCDLKKTIPIMKVVSSSCSKQGIP